MRDTPKTDVHHLSEIHWIAEGNHLILDAATIRNLELVRNLQDGGTWGTLLYILDRTKTAMGARRLKSWILYPLASEQEIKIRQQAIAELHEQPEVFAKLRELLALIVDLERQNGRIATGIANARDLLALGRSLEQLPYLRGQLQGLKGSFFKNLLDGWEDLKNVAKKIVETIRDEAPLVLKEGGLLRDGVLPELDELRAIQRDGQSTLARMEEEEKRKTGISSLKVRYNRVFGYYLEIPHSKRDAVPAHYVRKQTLVNAERYITPELKTYEDKVLGAEEKIRHLEYEHFIQLRTEVSFQAALLSRMARKISDLDALASLALVAQENNYTCPEFTDGRELKIEEGRHPVLEKLFPSNRFVPNDVNLSEDACRLILLTGPNMAGKSTILRQVALIALMAHVGSFVPAKKVSLGLVDRIFTRIGASDNLSKNQSTFWVEMEETANILRSATAKSLVVLDEIGRGTSTYDGLSVAWAVAEYLHDTVKAKGLFATHYHELTALSETRTAIQNFNIAVKEWKGEILFLYRMVPGGTSRSYGVQVAALAGLPPSVTERARAVLAELQKKGKNPPLTETPLLNDNCQMSLFQGPEKEVLGRLKDAELNTLTPIQALQLLYDLQEKIRTTQD
ncbi:MAG: DNA mismatch repair protein MutS [bacterium]